MTEDELENELERRRQAQQGRAAAWGIAVLLVIIVAIFAIVPFTGYAGGLFG